MSAGDPDGYHLSQAAPSRSLPKEVGGGPLGVMLAKACQSKGIDAPEPTQLRMVWYRAPYVATSAWGSCGFGSISGVMSSKDLSNSATTLLAAASSLACSCWIWSLAACNYARVVGVSRASGDGVGVMEGGPSGAEAAGCPSAQPLDRKEEILASKRAMT